MKEKPVGRVETSKLRQRLGRATDPVGTWMTPLTALLATFHQLDPIQMHSAISSTKFL